MITVSIIDRFNINCLIQC